MSVSKIVKKIVYFTYPGVKAPGTPKITYFPSLQTSAKLTLVSGFPSNKSTEGIESPSLIGAIFFRACQFEILAEISKKNLSIFWKFFVN